MLNRSFFKESWDFFADVGLHDIVFLLDLFFLSLGRMKTRYKNVYSYFRTALYFETIL